MRNVAWNLRNRSEEFLTHSTFGLLNIFTGGTFENSSLSNLFSFCNDILYFFVVKKHIILKKVNSCLDL